MQFVDHTRNFNTAKTLSSLYRHIYLSLKCLYLVLGDLFDQHLRSGGGGRGCSYCTWASGAPVAQYPVGLALAC